MTGERLQLDEPFEVEVSKLGGTATVAVAGELEAATVLELEAALPTVERGGGLVLDLRRLAFIDSSGIRVLMTLDVRARTEGWTLAIIQQPGAVQRVLDVCRVHERVRTVNDPAELE